MNFVWVGLGGCAGAMLRYSVYLLQTTLFPSAFPIATLAVNAIGAVCAGALWARHPSETVQLFLVVGVLGAFTTFSAFSLETLHLLRTGRVLGAICYVGLSLLLGVIGVWAGMRTQGMA